MYRVWFDAFDVAGCYPESARSLLSTKKLEGHLAYSTGECCHILEKEVGKLKKFCPFWIIQPYIHKWVLVSILGGHLAYCTELSDLTRPIASGRRSPHMTLQMSMWASSRKSLSSSKACSLITWLSIMTSWVWCHSSIVGPSSFGICHYWMCCSMHGPQWVFGPNFKSVAQTVSMI